MQLANGYVLTTTFWEDFSIADRFGEAAIKDTFKRAFNEWKGNYLHSFFRCYDPRQTFRTAGQQKPS